MQTLVIMVIALQLLWVCYTDIRFRLIHNTLVLTLMLSALVLGVLMNQHITLWPALMILLVGFILFCLNLVGAGDVKLMSVLALALTNAQLSNFIGFTALCGGLVTVVGLLIAWRQMRTKGVPYGVAISMGFLLAIFTA